ncbi:hypothetical protein Gpo141_00002722 [Globisporangium polare]
MVRRALAANAPVLVLTGLIGFTGYCVYFAHNQQITEKEQMRNGVIRDIKRDRLKRREFERQQQEQQNNETQE